CFLPSLSVEKQLRKSSRGRMGSLIPLSAELAELYEGPPHLTYTFVFQGQQRTARIPSGQAQLVQRCFENSLGRTEAAGVIRLEPRPHQQFIASAEAARARQIVFPNGIEVSGLLATEHSARAHGAIGALLNQQNTE